MDKDSNMPAEKISNEVESILSKSKKKIRALNAFVNKINKQNYTDNKLHKNMKTIKLIIAILFFASSAMAQVAINTSGNNPDASAMLEVTSTTKGLLIPRMTAAQRGQIASPATGLLIYQTDGTTGFYYNTGTPSAAKWIQLSSSLITELKDADSDTKVQVEASADEDKIRFDVGGSEKVIIDNNGNVGIGTTSPSAKLDVIDGAMLFSGTNGSTPTSGASTRMMWIPAKGAFRAGRVTGNLWDDGNIGNYSSAMGYNTIASGNCSFASGNSTEASGYYSISTGYLTTASGSISTAMGCRTTASGKYSIAMGYRTTASGKYSTSMGNGTSASGLYSSSLGFYTTAKSSYETTIGLYNTDYTPSSTNNYITTDRLFVIGNGTSSSATSNAMVVLKNGNTGIGFSSPTHKLEVNGSIKVGAYILPSTDGTNGQLLKTDGNGALSWANDGTNLWTESSGNVYRSSGRVGIGTSSPGEALHISGGSLKIESSNNDKIIFAGTNTNQHTFYDASSKGFRFWDATNGALMTITNTGKVGIGTGAPSCPLEINGSASLSASFGFLNSGGSTGTSNGTNPYSIKVSDRIMASEFNAVSDQRVKTNFEISNNISDLQILNQLEVTNYNYIDTVTKGHETRLGFIAQQVETVFPQAINKSTNFIPNIYKLSINIAFDSISNTQTITLLDNHNLQNGDMIKLYSNNKIYEREVIEVLSATEFKIETTLKANNQLFVFGKQVDDFRAVDYDRIFVLGISAIQELSKELEALKLENNNLKAENTTIKTTVQENSDRLKNLEKLIELQSSVINN